MNFAVARGVWRTPSNGLRLLETLVRTIVRHGGIGCWFLVVLLQVMQGGHTSGSYAAGHMRAHLRMLASQIDYFRENCGRLPDTLKELLTREHGGPYARESTLKDMWDRSFYYRRDPSYGYTVFTLGADGRVGGHGVNADHEIGDLRGPEEIAREVNVAPTKACGDHRARTARYSHRIFRCAVTTNHAAVELSPPPPRGTRQSRITETHRRKSRVPGK